MEERGIMNSTLETNQKLMIRTIPWVFILPVFPMIFLFIWLGSQHQLDIWSGLVISVVIAVLAYFAEYVSITFDIEARMVRFARIQAWRVRNREIPFEKFHTISVEEIGNQYRDGFVSFYNILFVLKTGENFHLTKFMIDRKANLMKTAQQMVDYMNLGHSEVRAALDGIVRVQNEGSTYGNPWQIEHVMNNDRPALTRWKMGGARFKGGFLLVVPNLLKMNIQSKTLPQSSWAGIAVNNIYRIYLETMDLATSDLPNFYHATVLNGSQVGLNDQFYVLTDNFDASEDWFDAEKKQLLLKWVQINPLNARKDGVIPHFLTTSKGFVLFFRGNYSNFGQVNLISKLGVALIR
jgi:hypothetical protein